MKVLFRVLVIVMACIGVVAVAVGAVHLPNYLNTPMFFYESQTWGIPHRVMEPPFNSGTNNVLLVDRTLNLLVVFEEARSADRYTFVIPWRRLNSNYQRASFDVFYGKQTETIVIPRQRDRIWIIWRDATHASYRVDPDVAVRLYESRRQHSTGSHPGLLALAAEEEIPLPSELGRDLERLEAGR